VLRIARPMGDRLAVFGTVSGHQDWSDMGRTKNGQIALQRVKDLVP